MIVSQLMPLSSVGTVPPLTGPRHRDQSVHEVVLCLPPALPHRPRHSHRAAAAQPGHAERHRHGAVLQLGVSACQPDHPAGAAVLPAGRVAAVRHQTAGRPHEPEPARAELAVTVVANTRLGGSSAQQSPGLGQLLVLSAGGIVAWTQGGPRAQPTSSIVSSDI